MPRYEHHGPINMQVSPPPPGKPADIASSIFLNKLINYSSADDPISLNQLGQVHAF